MLSLYTIPEAVQRTWTNGGYGICTQNACIQTYMTYILTYLLFASHTDRGRHAELPLPCNSNGNHLLTVQRLQTTNK